LAAIIANLHDVVIILGFFAFFQWEFSLSVLAAVLAVLGYSVNESVVVFDRIRENFRKMRKTEVHEIIDNAITRTMSRTIITHGCTQMMVTAMLFLGGETLHYFALALTIGILFSIYSSVLVASPLLMMLGVSREDFIKPEKTEAEEVSTLSFILLDIVLHLDAHLLALVHDYGVLVYAILFLIIFAETGLVVAPFLPGDSLLFVTGALCGMGSLELQVLMPLLMVAAFCGDNTNYWIGRRFGIKLFKQDSRFFKLEHVEKTQKFYAAHGGKTIIFARFLPIIRTFAPFVAGIGSMSYRVFVTFSALGSVAWISSLTLAGFFFGNIPIIKNNLTLMIVAIVLISFFPAIREFIRHRREKK
jgi:membrane-associated protein